MKKSDCAGVESSGTENGRTDKQGGQVNRRQFPSGVAALAAARWEAEDYDIENREPMEGGTYTTGTFSPGCFSTSGEGKVGGWLLEDQDLDERTLEVFYDTQEVHLTMEGKSDDVRSGGLAAFDPDQPRDLTAALYQAAEELNRRQEVTNADE